MRNNETVDKFASRVGLCPNCHQRADSNMSVVMYRSTAPVHDSVYVNGALLGNAEALTFELRHFCE